jgi:hypothetical protein
MVSVPLEQSWVDGIYRQKSPSSTVRLFPTPLEWY